MPEPTRPSPPQTLPQALRVLVVEDDAANLYSLERSLRHAGFETEVAVTVAQAMEFLGWGPHWLVLDLMLPDADAIDLLRHVREKDLPIKVAVVTGATDPRLLRECQDLRPEALLAKPIEMPALIERLK